MTTHSHTITFKPGSERWAVKVGADTDAVKVNMTPIVTTIAALRALPAPIKPTSRVVPAEFLTYQVTAVLSLAHSESDGDFHCVLGDADGHTMICEIADPDFVTVGPWVDQVKTVRQTFINAWGTPNGWITPLASVTVTGPAFYDRLHSQTGVAPNGIEIHCVLSLEIH